MRRIDKGLVDHLDEPTMNLCFNEFLCIFGIQYMYGKSSSSSLVSIPKEVSEKGKVTQRLRTDLGRSVGVTEVTPLVWLNQVYERSTFPLTAKVV